MKVLVAVAVLFGLGARAHADLPKPTTPPITDSKFKFKAPAGWKDKTTGDATLYTVAVDEPHSLVFQAKVQLGEAPADEPLLDRYAEEARKSVLRMLPDSRFKVLQKGLVTVAGVPAARFVFEMIPPGGGGSVRQLQFYIPTSHMHAVLTFTAPSEHFAENVALFEKTADATIVKP